jgi:hypothetical protein
MRDNKRFDFSKPGVILFLTIVLVGFVFGCRSTGGSASATQQADRQLYERLAVAPFQQTTPEEADIDAEDCSRCGFFARTAPSPESPEKIIETFFIEQMASSYKISMVPPERVAGMYERNAGDFNKTTPIQLLKKVGGDLAADSIAFGYVYRYRERKGYAYAAEKPASVAFEVHLFRVSDGALIWKGRFDKTQTSLMENIFQAPLFWKEGGKWITARELAEGGIHDILKTFPANAK